MKLNAEKKIKISEVILQTDIHETVTYYTNPDNDEENIQLDTMEYFEVYKIYKPDEKSPEIVTTFKAYFPAEKGEPVTCYKLNVSPYAERHSSDDYDKKLVSTKEEFGDLIEDKESLDEIWDKFQSQLESNEDKKFDLKYKITNNESIIKKLKEENLLLKQLLDNKY